MKGHEDRAPRNSIHTIIPIEDHLPQKRHKRVF